jgi:hypothetical protein
MLPKLDKRIRCKCGDTNVQEGMFVLQQSKYYLLTNNRKLNGYNAPNKNGYQYSIWIGDEGNEWKKILRHWNISEIHPIRMNHEE